MSTRPITDRDLPRLFDDLARGEYPAYVHQVLDSTSRSGQRPPWSFPGRWLPVEIDPGRLAMGRHAPVLVALLCLALAVAIAGLTLSGATRPTKSPPPFGPARNGALVMVDWSGPGARLIELDPVSGHSAPLGPTFADIHGVEFSNDGRLIKFGMPGGEPTTSWYVMNRDGTDARPVLSDRHWWPVAWAPDSHRILVGDAGRLSIRDIDTGSARSLDIGIEVVDAEWRPQHEQLIVGVVSGPLQDAVPELYVVNSNGSGLRSLGVSTYDPVLSPDGSTIAYEGNSKVHLLDIDTGADRELIIGGPDGVGDQPVAFSPDGTRLLIQRAVVGPDHQMVVDVGRRGIGASEYRYVIAPVAGGRSAVVLGTEIHLLVGGPGGSAMFSPDGTQIIAVHTGPKETSSWLFDAATGIGHEGSWLVSDDMSWQRLAP